MPDLVSAFGGNKTALSVIFYSWQRAAQSHYRPPNATLSFISLSRLMMANVHVVLHLQLNTRPWSRQVKERVIINIQASLSVHLSAWGQDSDLSAASWSHVHVNKVHISRRKLSTGGPSCPWGQRTIWSNVKHNRTRHLNPRCKECIWSTRTTTRWP